MTDEEALALMTTAERQAIAARHRLHEQRSTFCMEDAPHCFHDEEPWPCDAAALLAENEALRAALLAALPEEPPVWIQGDQEAAGYLMARAAVLLLL